MNDQMMNEGFWSVQNKVWLQMAIWMEWMRPFLYCLLAIALLCCLWAFVNMVMLCREEVFTKKARKKIKAHPKTEPVRPAENMTRVALKPRSRYAIKALFLLGYCCAFSLSMVQAQSPLLNTAIRNGDLKQVKTLIAKGENVNAPDADGTTPLMHAVVNAEADCVKLLLDKGADPNLSNKAGATALMWAVNDLKKVQLLLAKGANVNVASKEEESPLL
ncbi:MAG TPA: ankyrin repeat domain-containing protein, partial [Blastocatellia bacterium]|nr:ankyrin repeat domain-containing protein [Blastocatellia bacterium]